MNGANGAKVPWTSQTIVAASDGAASCIVWMAVILKRLTILGVQDATVLRTIGSIGLNRFAVAPKPSVQPLAAQFALSTS
jgi:hypothetical protein